jgi:hypothetical protein
MTPVVFCQPRVCRCFHVVSRAYSQHKRQRLRKHWQTLCIYWRPPAAESQFSARPFNQGTERARFVGTRHEAKH